MVFIFELNGMGLIECTGEGDNNMEQETPLTFDEILTDKDYQAEFDKRVSKAIETATNNAKSKWEEEFKAKMEQERTEAEKLAKMKEEERHQYELNQEKERADNAVNELNAYKLKDEVFNRAKDKGLDVSLLTDLDYSTLKAEQIDLILDERKKIFDKAVESAINERYKEKTPINIANGETPKKGFDNQIKLNPIFRNYN